MKIRKTLMALVAAGTLLATGAVAHAGAISVPGVTTNPVAAAAGTELMAPKPSWYTDALHAKVLAASQRGEGVAIPDGVSVPASALAFTGIRPGSWMIEPAGCTMNFVFGSPGKYHIGTAGHCTDVGDEVTIVAAPGILMNIGTTVKSVDNEIGDDFALVRISPEMQQHVNPSMAYFGGPTAVGSAQPGDIVEHVGHGLVIGTGGTPRAGVVVYRGEGENKVSDAFGWDGAATPGDSGSAVRKADGTAAGNLTHLVVGDKYAPAVIVGTSIQRMLRIAGLPLATAPDGPDPTS